MATKPLPATTDLQGAHKTTTSALSTTSRLAGGASIKDADEWYRSLAMQLMRTQDTSQPLGVIGDKSALWEAIREVYVGTLPDWVTGKADVDTLAIKEVFELGHVARIDMVKTGVPAHTVVDLAKQFGIAKDALISMLGLAPSTINRKISSNTALSQDESERVVGLMKVVGQVQVMVEQSGFALGFDAPKWLAGWMETEVPALGGKRPADFLDTADGRELVSGMLARMQSGAYS